MANTTFNVELDLNLPDQVLKNIETSLQRAVIAEIAKTDLAGSVKLEPLPASSERFSPILSGVGQTFGFVMRPILEALGEQRAKGRNDRGADGNIAAMPFLGFPVFTEMPFGTTNITELLESLYMRPDVRAAIISNSRAFAELLSRDEQANTVFNELIGEMNLEVPAERLVPLVVGAILFGSVVAGAIVGWLSRADTE